MADGSVPALVGVKVARVDARLRIGILDHDPEMGLTVDRSCAEGTHRVGRLLESLGHHVEPGWPPALDHLWRDAFEFLAIASDATRPAVLEWISGRLGRPVRRGELDDSAFDAAERAAYRSDAEVQAARLTMRGHEPTLGRVIGEGRKSSMTWPRTART